MASGTFVDPLLSRPSSAVMTPPRSSSATKTTSLKTAARSGREFFAINEEPDLDDVLDDPMVRTLMRRDGVARAHLEAVIASARLQLRLS